MKTFSPFLIFISVAVSITFVQADTPPSSHTAQISPHINPLRFMPVTDSAEYIHLAGEKIDPLAATTAAGTDASATLALARRDVQDNVRLVQLKGPLTDEKNTFLRNNGYTVLGYIPDNTYIVRSSGETLNTLALSPDVRWAGNYAPEFKIAPRLSRELIRKENDLNAVTRIRAFFPGDVIASACRNAAETLGTVDTFFANESECILEVTLPVENVDAFARIPHLLYLEHAPQTRTMNNESMTISAVRPMWDIHNYYGSNEIVAVADSGIDIGTTGPGIHADFKDGAGNSRIIYIWDFLGDGANDSYSGHGTHVAGTVLGSGILSGSNPANNVYPSTAYAGAAPMAHLVFQALGSNDPAVANAIFTPADLRVLFQNAYVQGARIHQNSWGANVYGAYNMNARALDDFAFNNPDMLITFSAGNAGEDIIAPFGVVDPQSIGAPGTAKNCITVGASEGNRPSHTETWSMFGFANAPIQTDRIANNISGMAAFSSRGPCGDGRIKPDIVAPGTFIASTRTHAPLVSPILWGNGYILAGNTNYVWSGGTSMSTPIVSGAAVVLRNYLREERGYANPSAVLLKSLLLNGAVDLTPGQYGTGAQQEIHAPPSNVQGWGRLALEDTLFKDSYYDFTVMNGWDFPFAAPGVAVTNVAVVNTNHPLNITLTWSDFMGSIFSLDQSYSYASGGGIVNDLDLRVINPSGSTNFPLAVNNNVNLYYYTNNNNLTWFNSPGLFEAQQCRAPELPLTLDRLYVLLYCFGGSGGSIDIYLWAGGNAPGTPPGAVLASTVVTLPGGANLWYVPINIGSIPINTRYFYIGAQQHGGSEIRVVRDPASNSGRSWQNSGGGWVVDSAGDLWIHAYGNATTYDHVNTVEGIRIPTPEVGTYRIEVVAENIPYPPVRYAVAVSGGLVPEPTFTLFLFPLLLLLRRYMR